MCGALFYIEQTHVSPPAIRGICLVAEKIYVPYFQPLCYLVRFKITGSLFPIFTIAMYRIIKA
jgi:hypothetical protein